jgi:hypothetical protein
MEKPKHIPGLKIPAALSLILLIPLVYHEGRGQSASKPTCQETRERFAKSIPYAIPPESSSEQAEWKELGPEDNRYLAREYSRRMRRAAKDTEINRAARFVQQAINSYYKKRYEQSRDQFERALALYPGDDAYFNYAKTLSKLGKYCQAIRAYKLYAGHKPELALYGIACVYSLKNDLTRAYDYLQQAFDRGYYTVNGVTADPDLKNLRDGPGWPEQLTELKKRKLGYTENDLAGVLVLPGYAMYDYYYLCSKGRVVRTSSVDCTPVMYVGKWKLAEGEIRIQYTRKIFRAGVGKPLKTDSDCGESYGDYRVGFENTNYSEVIHRSDIAESMRDYKGMEPWRYGIRNTLKKFPECKDLNQCNPNFVFKKLADLDIRDGE